MTIRLILMAMLLLTGCGEDTPTAPQVDEPMSLHLITTTYVELLATDHWFPQPDRVLSAAGNWHGESVSLTARFNPNNLSSVSIDAPLGCDLVYVEDLPIGANLYQLIAKYGDPTTRQGRSADWILDDMRINYFDSDGRVWTIYARL